MKFKNNCGVDSSTLENGYSDTGFIPEDGASVFKEEKEEDTIICMKDEVKTGGFLERKNVCDRY